MANTHVNGTKSQGQRRSGNSDQAADPRSRASVDISSLAPPERISSLSFIPAEMVRRAPKNTTAQMAPQLSIGKTKIARDDLNPTRGRRTAAAGNTIVALHNHTRASLSTFGSIAASTKKWVLRPPNGLGVQRHGTGRQRPLKNPRLIARRLPNYWNTLRHVSCSALLGGTRSRAPSASGIVISRPR